MDFSSYLVSDFTKLVARPLLDSGFYCALVGGTPRDFFLEFPNKHDYDCELRQIKVTRDFEEKFLALKFDTSIEVTKLPYNILRLTHQEFSCELSLPRIETFTSDFSHSNFSATFSPDLSHAEALVRRDFTINAIYFEFNNGWNLIDPLGGKDDLANKKLVPCSDNFDHDPIRFLRALRFRNNLEFTLDQEIVDKFSSLKMNDFSSHYVKYEAVKSSKPITFFLDLCKLLKIDLECDYYNEISLFESSLSHIGTGELKRHLDSLFFIDHPTRKLLYTAFGFTLKSSLSFKNICYGDLAKLGCDEFKEYVIENDFILWHKLILSLRPRYVQVFNDLKMIDLSFLDLQKLDSTKVDISNVSNSDKAVSKIYKQIEMYFGN